MKTPLSPKKTAFLIAAAFHFPFLLIGLVFPLAFNPPDLPTAKVLLGLERSLEIALVQKEASWEVQSAGLPPLLDPQPAPAVIYSSLVLVKGGKIFWAKSHPLLDAYLLTLRFALTEEVRTGYLAIGPKR